MVLRGGEKAVGAVVQLAQAAAAAPGGNIGLKLEVTQSNYIFDCMD